MEPQAILLLVIAAFAHSGWNLLAKKSLDKQAFLWLSLLATLAVLAVPFWYLYTPLPADVWLLVLASGVLEAIYFMLLSTAYDHGDLSLVYPLARGSAPLFVTVFAAIFLSERPSQGGMLGILLIVAGIYTLHLRSLDLRGLYAPLHSLRQKASQLAILVGVTIASYSVVDKAGVMHANPLVYIYPVFVVATLLMTIYIVLVKRATVPREWRVNRFSVIAVGILSPLAFLLVLTALTVSHVSYVSSVREMSVVVAAALGTLVLREPFGKAKILGAVLIFAGVVSIALAA